VIFLKSALKKFWKNISMRKKLLLYTSMLLYVFILLLGLLIYNRAVDTFSEMSEQNTTEQLQYLSDSIKNRLEGYSDILASMLLDSTFHEKLENRPHNTAKVQQYDSDIHAYITAACSGKSVPVTWEVYFSEDTSPFFNPNFFLLETAENSSWYQKIQSYSRNTISWLLEPETQNDPCRFTCAVGIRNNKTLTLPAYVKLSIRLTCITDLIRDTAEDVNGIFLLCSPAGEIYWCNINHHTGYESYIPAAFSSPDMKTCLCDGDLGERTVTRLDGGKYGYILICVRDTETPMVKYVSFSRYFLVVTLIIMAFSFFILFFSSHLVDGRITSLTAQIRNIDENDLSCDLDVIGQDEVGELSRAFSSLLERIKTLIEHERQFEKERYDLEIQALQSQINPHFLFNTLSVINLLAREIDADNISESLDALANFYRLSLNNGEKLISLRDELNMLDSYLKICSIRYRGQLILRQDIAPDTLDCIIPKLIIQPFCENAVFHGFSPDMPQVPELHISIHRKEPYLFIAISDNGEGMTDKELRSATKRGFAISNVDKRIKMFYGDDCGVTISSIPGQGTDVLIKLGTALNRPAHPPSE